MSARFTREELDEQFRRYWRTGAVEERWSDWADLFTEDVVYDNIPMERLEGKAAAEAFIRNGMDIERVDWELISIAENGDKVLTERLDNFYLTNGKTVSMPVMGTFEIEGDKIKAWRDYFDLATFTSQMA